MKLTQVNYIWNFDVNKSKTKQICYEFENIYYFIWLAYEVDNSSLYLCVQLEVGYFKINFMGILGMEN